MKENSFIRFYFRWSGIFLTFYFNPVFSQSTEGLVQPNLKFAY